MGLLYPLRFQPLLRRYIWGGRRLEAMGKTLGPESDYAESWEVVDHGDDQSVVAFGPLAGRTLAELTREAGQGLAGQTRPRARRFHCSSSFSMPTNGSRSKSIRTTPRGAGSIRPI